MGKHAGYVANHFTACGANHVVYKTAQAGIQSDYPYVCECVDHGRQIGAFTQAGALVTMKKIEWCSACESEEASNEK